MDAWPHQTYALERIYEADERRVRRVLVTSPTGGGKTFVMESLTRRFLEEKMNVSLYTNRRLLIEQLSQRFSDSGIYHGVRAAGHADEREHPFQISSIQTEVSRVLKQKKWKLHPAHLVIVDEAHLHKETTAKQILDLHAEAGALIVGFTATPIDLEPMYDELIVAGNTEGCRACGALVLAYHFGPDEPDLREFKAIAKKIDAGEELTEGDNRKVFGPTPQLFGRVWDHYERLNPEHKPTILFGAGRAESLWFAEKFTERGVRAAHIDGDSVWLDGELMKSDQTIRESILAGSKDGSIKVICNRFVLREGIDCPWLAHGIFATMFGSLQSYLQSGGRLLRAFPGMDHVTIQDHGGNWWRHGPLNDNRDWELDLTSNMVAAMRAEKLRKDPAKQPFRCPQCGRTWKAGRLCNPAWGGCGYEIPNNLIGRPVVTTDGTMSYLSGAMFKPRRISKQSDGPYRWAMMHKRSCYENGARTFRAAAALYAVENDWQWPDPNWPLMPIQEKDWFRYVADVPRERLTR